MTTNIARGIKDYNSSISEDEPLYLGRTLSPMALAIFLVVTQYTISNMNVVIGDEGVNGRAALPSDDEEGTEARTSGEEYMATA